MERSHKVRTLKYPSSYLSNEDVSTDDSGKYWLLLNQLAVQSRTKRSTGYLEKKAEPNLD